MRPEKANPIYLLHVLRKYSDETHILPMHEILKKLRVLYDCEIDRRTVYNYVELLQTCGFDISTYAENGAGYYLREREFEKAEIRLLVDAVCSFPFIPPDQSRKLIQKLQQFSSRYERKQYQHLTVVRQKRKTQNKQVFLNIELLDEAIEKQVKVRFSYLTYDAGKNLVPRRSEPYTVNPYGMIYTNEHYYLICNLCGYENMSLYRIDRISTLVVLNEPVNFGEKSVAADSARAAIYAFIGQPENVEFNFDKFLLNDVIDRFGTDIDLSNDGDRWSVRVTVAPQGMRFWALQYLPYVEVKKPEWLRKEIIKAVQSNRYKEDT